MTARETARPSGLAAIESEFRALDKIPAWHPGVASLTIGTLVYWVIAFAFPELRSAISATIPTILVVTAVYSVTARRGARLTQPSATAATLPPPA